MATAFTPGMPGPEAVDKLNELWDRSASTPLTPTAVVFTRNQSVTPSTLASGESVVVDASLSNNFRLVLALNATLSNPSNLTDGMVLNFYIQQDAAGNRTLAYGAAYTFAGGVKPTLSTLGYAVDFMSCYYDGVSGKLICSMAKGYA